MPSDSETPSSFLDTEDGSQKLTLVVVVVLLLLLLLLVTGSLKISKAFLIRRAAQRRSAYQK